MRAPSCSMPGERTALATSPDSAPRASPLAAQRPDALAGGLQHRAQALLRGQDLGQALVEAALERLVGDLPEEEDLAERGARAVFEGLHPDPQPLRARARQL